MPPMDHQMGFGRRACGPGIQRVLRVSVLDASAGGGAALEREEREHLLLHVEATGGIPQMLGSGSGAWEVFDHRQR